jgi:hypothetical protein
VDAASLLDPIASALGLDGFWAHETLIKAFQVLVVAVSSIWIAHRLGDSVRRAVLKQGRASPEAAALLSRAVTFGIYAIAVTIALAMLGVNWAALAAVLGAATLTLTLALQDVLRSFVNGIYLLIERPFRIGDRISIGAAAGEVEDVGVRVTVLRTQSGQRIIVPNTVVFSSTIENRSAGPLERRQYALKGVTRALPEIAGVVSQALAGIPHLSQRPPIVDVIEARPDGTDVTVTVEYAAGHRLDDVVVDHLRGAFPEATITPLAAAGGA